MIKKIITLIAFLATHNVFAQSITISEINYKSDPTRDAGDWIELHNFGSNAIDLSNYQIIDSDPLSTAFVIPSGTNLAAGAYLVVYANITKFIAEYPTVSNRIGPFTFGLSKTGDNILLKNPSGIPVLTVAYTDSLGWTKGAAGNGRTLELRNQNSNQNLSNANSWFDGCMGGSPGRAYSATCNDNIVFSEINYNSAVGYNHGEFIELHNRTANAINLAGYGFRDSRDTITNIYYFASGVTLPANGYLVLTNQLDTFQMLHPGVTNVLGNFNFSFDNSGESLRLFNASGRLVFSVFYRDTLTLANPKWPNKPDGLGYTLELLNETANNMNDGSNWFAGCFLGSPGTSYNASCVTGVDINQSDLADKFQIFPNPSNGKFQIKNEENKALQLNIYSPMGSLIYSEISNEPLINIDLQSFSSGIYNVVVTSKDLNYSKKLVLRK